MSWENILKQGALIDSGGEKWPPELIGFYDPQKQTTQTRNILVPSKDDIPQYQSREGWEEIKLTFLSIGAREGTADYSYEEGMKVPPSQHFPNYVDIGGQIIVNRRQAIWNFLGRDYNLNTGEKNVDFNTWNRNNPLSRTE